jgi:hypothetical protein
MPPLPTKFTKLCWQLAYRYRDVVQLACLYFPITARPVAATPISTSPIGGGIGGKVAIHCVISKQMTKACFLCGATLLFTAAALLLLTQKLPSAPKLSCGCPKKWLQKLQRLSFTTKINSMQYLRAHALISFIAIVVVLYMRTANRPQNGHE